LNAEFLFYLVLIELVPDLYADLPVSRTDPLEVKEGILPIHSSLCFTSTQAFYITHEYSLLLQESLSHPVHAGKYVLDGQQYASVARLLLNYLLEPSSGEYFLWQVVLFPAINGILK
jgi:hypothetical protein